MFGHRRCNMTVGWWDRISQDDDWRDKRQVCELMLTRDEGVWDIVHLLSLSVRRGTRGKSDQSM